MKKRKKIKNVSPDEIATDFWKSIYRDVVKRISSNIKESDHIESKDKKHHLQYLRETRKQTKDKPILNLDSLMVDFNYLVKPNLPLQKIEACLKELNIDDKKRTLIIFVLKPTPVVEHIIHEYDNPTLHALNQGYDEICNNMNNKIKQLSPLAGKLQKLIDEDESFKTYTPIQLTILFIERQIEIYRCIIKIKRDQDKRYLSMYNIDKNIRKSPQKHKYWNHAVSTALEVLNPYCHTGDCERNCKKTHQKAYLKIAELLKILYPSIWKEDINKIANLIKQKDYRTIPA